MSYRPRRSRGITSPVFMLVGSLALSSCCLFFKFIAKPERTPAPPPAHPIMGDWKAVPPAEIWTDVSFDSKLEFMNATKVERDDNGKRIRQEYVLEIDGEKIALLSSVGKYFIVGKWATQGDTLYLTFPQFGKSLIFSRSGK